MLTYSSTLRGRRPGSLGPRESLAKTQACRAGGRNVMDDEGLPTQDLVARFERETRDLEERGRRRRRRCPTGVLLARCKKFLVCAAAADSLARCGLEPQRKFLRFRLRFGSQDGKNSGGCCSWSS